MRTLSFIHVLVRTSIAGVLAVALAVPASADPSIIAAGDISCGNPPCRGARGTARLIGRLHPTAVLALGDNQYPDGALRDYRRSYDLTWGRFERKTHPTPGNHDYGSSRAAGYFGYFGARAHRARGGFYSFNLGRWHIISVNSGPGRIPHNSLGWISRNLNADHHLCELAYWHHPRWSSGREHGSDQGMSALWGVLFRAGVDVVLNGHEHNYERFALMAPSGGPAPRIGIREFVVGTGGFSHYRLGNPIRGSQRRIDNTFGVLRMILHERSYSWRFITSGRRVADRGQHACHR